MSAANDWAAFDIRPCEQADLPAVRLLLQQLSETSPAESDFSPELLAGLLEAMQQAPAVYLNLVAELSGQVVGFISLIFYQTLFHRGGTALINELVVDREQRGIGIGRALAGRAIAEARARGMDELEVATERTNLAAQAFYRRCGFDQEYVLFGMDV